MAEYIRQQQLEMAVTTIYVTHDQAEALSMADRMAVMDDGVVEQVGTPEAVARPLLHALQGRRG